MWNILIGVVFLIGGLSGKMVFIGTNSSSLLVMASIGLIVWGLVQIANGKKG